MFCFVWLVGFSSLGLSLMSNINEAQGLIKKTPLCITQSMIPDKDFGNTITEVLQLVVHTWGAEA